MDNFSGQPVDNFSAVDKLWITFAAKKPQKELTGVCISENEFTGVCIFRKLKKPGCVFFSSKKGPVAWPWSRVATKLFLKMN